MIYQAQRTDFIDIISKNENAIFLFHSKEDKSSPAVKKIKTQLKEIAGESKDINIHLFVTDEDEATKEFSQVLELEGVPTMVVYKNGCFNRYKNKEFTTASIKKFIGSSKKKQTIDVDSEV